MFQRNSFDEGWLDLTNDETWVISNGFTGV